MTLSCTQHDLNAAFSDPYGWALRGDCLVHGSLEIEINSERAVREDAVLTMPIHTSTLAYCSLSSKIVVQDRWVACEICTLDADVLNQQPGVSLYDRVFSAFLSILHLNFTPQGQAFLAELAQEVALTLLDQGWEEDPRAVIYPSGVVLNETGHIRGKLDANLVQSWFQRRNHRGIQIFPPYTSSLWVVRNVLSVALPTSAHARLALRARS